MIDAVPQKRANHWALIVGLIIWALAILWWLAYYGQWDGWFGLIDVKIGCLMGDAFECGNFRDFIGPSTIPVYWSPVWYLGFVFVAIGLFMSRRKKA